MHGSSLTKQTNQKHKTLQKESLRLSPNVTWKVNKGGIFALTDKESLALNCLLLETISKPKRWKLEIGWSSFFPLHQDPCDNPSPCHIRTAAERTSTPVSDLSASALSVALITAVITKLSPSLRTLLHHLAPPPVRTAVQKQRPRLHAGDGLCVRGSKVERSDGDARDARASWGWTRC